MTEPIPGTEREQIDEEDVGMPGLDEGTEIDSDISDEQRTAKPKKKYPRKASPIAGGFMTKQALARTVGSKLFERTVLQRMKLYRRDALDVLHDLAMMPRSDNSANNHLKYLAACKLVGNLEAPEATNNALPDFLKKLNDDYRKNAPRIKEVRERTVTFEDAPPKLVN
jgi:hypothetical protein